MIKRTIIGLACLALLPSQASAAAAAVAAAAATAATAGAASSSNSSRAQQMPQGVAGAPIEWAEVGWLRCPSRYAEPSGCRETVERDWRPDAPGDVEPWVEWMKRHKGEDARFMGMTIIEHDVRLFYGVPAEDGQGGGE
ncbi:hypothetical protein [Halomonas getboli]|uniref:hypothetical protein n=1 Tax=Halomonas getboli TaxID=2935862 RepID=UPI001FFF9A07|nr:hypothetical protein [Halomonas getboli]MCK2185720.1 hypothetical protein [Halomonas getboli]